MNGSNLGEANAIIVGKKILGNRFVELTIHEESIAHSARPGQFVMVGTGDGYDPLLKRPLGVFRVFGDHFSLLFEIVGRGTDRLGKAKIGDCLSVLGPLGKGFTLGAREAWLLAGGRGLVPLFFLAVTLQEQNTPFSIFFGVQAREELVLADYLRSFPGSFSVTCEEATQSHACGTVLDLFQAERNGKPVPPGVWVYACGPEGLYQAMQNSGLFQTLPVEVSLEARMGCGFGVCLSCAIPKSDGENFHHVCSDGPVFELSEVFRWT
ncbi:MAG TPA: hypothetical protein VLH40_01360 [Atribacteraceae bacterium]|nr:hypothetical protein [Atribacteraceae bacterium]